MAAGCAIVATELGDAARYFPPGDVDALRRHLEQLTAEDSARRALGEAAARRAKEHFGWREIGRRYRELLADVTRGAS